MLDHLFKRTQHLVQQSVERMLKQMLKPFKRALTCIKIAVRLETGETRKWWEFWTTFQGVSNILDIFRSGTPK